MQFWSSALFPDGIAGSGGDEQNADGDHHGSDPDGEYSSVWDVQQYGQSGCGICNSSCYGSIDTDAVYSCHSGAVVTGKPDNPDRSKTMPESDE